MKHLCLNCEKADMVRGKINKVVEYRGKQITIAAVDGWHCPACGECEFARGEGKRYVAAVEHFRGAIDKQESVELARIRKKLKLSQKEAAAIAGGGINAFSRYENGKARPVAAVVNLFRILDKHPELVNEIR
jgi:HTH-type transcriptional regulator/antitoxin MqsA